MKHLMENAPYGAVCLFVKEARMGVKA